VTTGPLAIVRLKASTQTTRTGRERADYPQGQRQHAVTGSSAGSQCHREPTWLLVHSSSQPRQVCRIDGREATLNRREWRNLLPYLKMTGRRQERCRRGVGKNLPFHPKNSAEFGAVSREITPPWRRKPSRRLPICRCRRADTCRIRRRHGHGDGPCLVHASLTSGRLRTC